MRDDQLAPIINDPTLATPEAARALLALADSVSWGDPDIAGDVVVILAERLRPGGGLHLRLDAHANSPALLTRAAKNAATQSWERTQRHKRVMPLTRDGDIAAAEAAQSPFTPTIGLFDLLEDLGWTRAHLEVMATPRKRPGRSIHPGIEAAMERVATCYGITVRCPGCPTPMELLRLDLRGPDSWPALVPVLQEWGWSDALIRFITTSPANTVARSVLATPPPERQERRMAGIVHQMRWDPWYLTDSQVIRDSIKPAHVRPPRPIPPAGTTFACRLET